MKYRSRTDIITQVLQATNQGASKTRMMYGAYLSYAQINEYTKFLLEKELLRYQTETRIYNLTEKGMQFLRDIEGINRVISMNSSPVFDSPWSPNQR